MVQEKGTGHASFTRATSLPCSTFPLKEGCRTMLMTAVETESWGLVYRTDSPSWMVRSCRFTELRGKQEET